MISQTTARFHRARRNRGVAAFGLAIALCLPLPARADEADSEAPDPTRLDVERLPPEAIEITRDMFARGLFVEAYLGSRTFFGALGKLAQPGLMTRIGLGYELTDWIMFGAGFELSMHALQALPPPSAANFQLLDALAEARLQWPISARAALSVAGEAGFAWTPGNLLVVHGFADADALALMYGGSLRFDWHLLSRHHSLGLLGGARLYPNLERSGAAQPALAAHGSAYIRYVF
jgi:hypothetical protein